MTDQPTPQTEALLARFIDTHEGPVLVEDGNHIRGATELELAFRAAAQARTEALDVDALAEALHDAMCDVSHHDRPPARCSRWLTYPSIARSVVPRYAAILAAKADR